MAQASRAAVRGGGRLLRGPARPRPRLADDAKPFTRGELDKLRAHLVRKAGREQLRRGRGAVAGPRTRDLLLLDLLVSTGLRASEVARLTVRDLHLRGGEPTLEVRGGKKRHKEHVDVLPLPLDLAARLERFCWVGRDVSHPHPENLARVVFARGHWCEGAPLGRRGVWEIIKRAVRHCGLRPELTVHSLRHSFLTALASQPGADPLAVMRLGRVRDLATVMTYFHLARGTARGMVEAAAELSGSVPARRRPASRPGPATAAD